MTRRWIVGVAALAVAACSSLQVPRVNTHDEVKSYVDRAAAVVAQHGAGACTILGSPRWYSGDWYIIVSELDGPTICHPARPDLVGKPEREVTDPNGKRVGEEIIRLAGGPEKGGWVEYVWPRPGQTAPVAKSTYVRAVTGPDGKTYVVGSGGYELR